MTVRTVKPHTVALSAGMTTQPPLCTRSFPVPVSLTRLHREQTAFDGQSDSSTTSDCSADDGVCLPPLIF